jgi:lytic murein transglycosylase
MVCTEIGVVQCPVGRGGTGEGGMRKIETVQQGGRGDWRGRGGVGVTSTRSAKALSAIALAALVWLAAGRPAAAETFAAWREAFRPEAMAFGIRPETFERAFRGLEPDTGLPDLVLPGRKAPPKGQAEFVRHPKDYLDERQLERLAERGRRLAREHAGVLAKIEHELGVPPAIVLAIWGRETAFGSHKSPHYAIRALATQAWIGRRKDMFRRELLHALKLVDDGVRSLEQLKSSWAGAMGLTQFMPSEFYTHGRDGDGDGRIDLWGSVPDALASAARQLHDKGWVAREPWGLEVRLTGRTDCAEEGPTGMRPLAEWRAGGVVPMRAGQPATGKVEDATRAYLMSPMGTHGPIFLATENFAVIRRYNMSDLYAVFVGTLADRIAGGGGFVAPWRGGSMPRTVDIEGVQQGLLAAGRPIGTVDGKIGSITRREVGLYQRGAGLAVDCWPSAALAKRLADRPNAPGPRR